MSETAQSHVTTHDDGRFIRTAIVIQEEGTSFDLVDKFGKRLAVVNGFVYRNDDDNAVNHIIVDVIDVDDNFSKKFALTFHDGARRFADTNGNLVSADFRTEDYGQ